MPRSNRGGARTGTPGTAYANRTDLNVPKTTVPGQEYGKATQQRAAQDAIPMAQSPIAAAPSPQPAPSRVPGVSPGSLSFLDPTARPEEPIQAGLPSGPGPGPEALTGMPSNLLSSSLRFLTMSPNATSAAYDLLHSAQTLGL